MHDPIKLYWEERAEHSNGKLNATTDDMYFRELEINTICNFIDQYFPNNKLKILDLGCGDGYMALSLAKRKANINIEGFDFASKMIAIANAKLAEEGEIKKRVSFNAGNILELSALCKEGSYYDLVITSRVLINLRDKIDQYKVIENIPNLLTPNGYYLGFENFIESHELLNQARQTIGLSAIPIRWHNHYFVESEFIKHTSKLFAHVEIIDFASSYFFATRVVYSLLCKAEDKIPDYNHLVHQQSINLPSIGKFCPVRFIVLKKL